MGPIAFFSKVVFEAKFYRHIALKFPYVADCKLQLKNIYKHMDEFDMNIVSSVPDKFADI